MTTCPHCGGDLEAPARASITVEDLRAECLAQSLAVFAGDRVDVDTAAHLVGRSVGTLRNWAIQKRPLTVYRLHRYALADVAAYLNSEPD